MDNKFSHLITYLVIILLFNRCMTDDDIDDNCLFAGLNQNISISVNDSLGKNLIGENNIYNPDSISLFKNNQVYNFSVSGQNRLIISYEKFTKVDTLYLQLNKKQIDTINFNLSIVESKCPDYLQADKVFLNGKEIIENQTIKSYAIIK